jgi:hypothetical protein
VHLQIDGGWHCQRTGAGLRAAGRRRGRTLIDELLLREPMAKRSMVRDA